MDFFSRTSTDRGANWAPCIQGLNRMLPGRNCYREDLCDPATSVILKESRT